MNDERAIEVLKMLLDGVHPVTGKPLPKDGIHAEPEVMMALYKATGALYREKEG